MDGHHLSSYFQVLQALYQFLVTVRRALVSIGIIVSFMFHCFFFNSLARSRYLFFFSLSFNFNLWSTGTVKSTILLVLFFVDYHNYYHYYYYYYFESFFFLHRGKLLIFSAAWVPANILKSSGLVPVFWPISTML